MSSSIGTSGGNKTISAITVGTALGNKAVVLGYVGTSGGNKVFFSALSASASPGSYSPTLISAPDTAVQGPSVVTVTGGIGPFTYSWVRTSGSIINADSPSSSSTTFSAFFALSGQNVTNSFVCTVTDTATGLTANTNTVTSRLGSDP